MSHHYLARQGYREPVRGLGSPTCVCPTCSRYRAALRLVPQLQKGFHLLGGEEPVRFVAWVEEEGGVHESLALDDVWPQ
jgi:hypothetical protein